MLSRRRLGLATALAIIATACSSGGGNSTASTTTSGTASRRTPAYVGTLRPKLAARIHELLVPGAAVAVRSPDLGDWSTTFGTRTLGGATPVGFGDHVRIGSNTKTVTGTVILQLVQEGKLALDDPVSKYRPDVPNGQNITVTQLLNMRSGL
jgi:D-alanyl-D-alanine carboxypeptidase